MFTDNCRCCEKVFEKMEGKLLINVKVPDGAIFLDHVYVSQNGGLFDIKIAVGSTFIYDLKEDMEIYAHLNSLRYDNTDIIKVKADTFTHIIIDYDYYYYQNQPRIKRLRWQEVEHKTQKQLYDTKF